MPQGNKASVGQDIVLHGSVTTPKGKISQRSLEIVLSLDEAKCCAGQ